MAHIIHEAAGIATFRGAQRPEHTFNPLAKRTGQCGRAEDAGRKLTVTPAVSTNFEVISALEEPVDG